MKDKIIVRWVKIGCFTQNGALSMTDFSDMHVVGKIVKLKGFKLEIFILIWKESLAVG